MKPKGRGDQHQVEYSKIMEKVYIGSDFCEGPICRVHGPEFKKLGICTELNLSVERNEVPPEGIDVYAWIPVVDGYAPTLDQLAIGSAIIHESVELSNIVYVHCKNGHGRSPTMVAAYLTRYKGYEVGEAIKLIEEKRPEVHVEEVQIEALKEFSKKWK